MQDCLERRKQGVLIPTDIKGAFDRCWWKRLKNRLKKKGMRKRALTLIKHYLFQRFLRVVANGTASQKKEIFSSVPPGGKLSAPLWDFDISGLADKLSAELIPFGLNLISSWTSPNLHVVLTGSDPLMKSRLLV